MSSFLISGFNPLVFTINNSFFPDSQTLHASVVAASKQYLLDIGPVTGSTTANYVYASFFNPSGSGRTASIKRIAIRTDTASSTASNYVDLTVRRITAASAGTQSLASNFPKKNGTTVDSIMEVRNTNVTVTMAGTVDSRILDQPLSGAVGAYHSKRDIYFGSSDEKIIIQPGEGIAVYQEAAGTAATNARILIEWEETVNAPSASNEFLFAFPRVEVAASANYVYNSFFNPSSSGKTAIIKRIWFGTETCASAATYINSIVLRRTSAASAGTAITAVNIPQKNTASSASVMDFRHTNVTVTQVGSSDARLGHINPCGASGEANGWQNIDFNSNDEKLILQQGEGIALVSETAGSANQLVRMIVEWQEVPVASTPTSQREYLWASPKVAAATALNTTEFSFFNPVGSGKTAVVKRIIIRADATTTAAYTSYQFRRITAASGGNLIAASDLPKKHTGTANSLMEMRWCGFSCASAIAATYLGSVDSRILSVMGAGAVGQTVGQREISFSPNEKLVLKEGEGIGFYNDVLASSAAEAVKVSVEWDEETVAPSALGEYVMDIGPINGVNVATYNYATFFNPASSTINAVIKRVSVRVDSNGAAAYEPFQLRRISAASGGTQIIVSSVPKKNTASADNSVEIRRTGVTATYWGTTDSKLLAVQSPGAVASAIAGNTGYKEIVFNNTEPIVLKPGQGVGLYSDTSNSDTNFRVRLLIEWGEQASAPTALNEFMTTVGPIVQSLVSGYVYSTLFNPLGSAKNYIVKRIAVQADRNGAATVPAYTPITIRRITAASAGTLVATTTIPQKNSSSASSTAEIRNTGVTVTLANTIDSRVLGATVSGLVNQVFGDYESAITPGDELVIKPGEGLALYQEQATGDANVRLHFSFEWAEQSNTAPPQSLTFSISTSTVYFGQASSIIPLYASSTNINGDGNEVEAHSFLVVTNATNGYTITAKGQTLTSGVNSILPIGGTNTASAVGTEQFGIRLTQKGGSGSVTAPYAAAGFAYAATATTSSQVASVSIGDNATTTYSVRYLVNIAPKTLAATYTANVVYVATANF